MGWRRKFWLDPAHEEPDDYMEPAGKWWGYPTWRKLLIWFIWRPPYWLWGKVWNFRMRTADRLWRRFGRDIPFFRIRKWVGRGREFEAPDTWNDLSTPEQVAEHVEYFNRHIVEVHEGPTCSCTNSHVEEFGYPHNLMWLPAPEYDWMGDRFWTKADAAYRFKDTPERRARRMKAGRESPEAVPRP